MRIHQQDFEIACLFRDDMHVGCFVKIPDSKVYLHVAIEAMYQGYVMGRKAK